MARRKKYDNERFAKDLTAFFERSEAETQNEFGALFNVSQNTAHLWMDGATFPMRGKRDKILEVSGIDINTYRLPVTGQGNVTGHLPTISATAATHGDNSPIIPQAGHTNRASIKNSQAPGQIINQGPQLNAMECDLISTMRLATLADWQKVTLVLDEIKSRG